MHRLLVSGVAVLAVLLAGCSTGSSAELKKGWDFMLAADYPAARDHYEGMLTEYPENPYVHLNLGVVYHQLGNLDLVRQHYEAAVTYGEDAAVSRVVEKGEVAPTVTTVADKGRENLKLLGG